MPDTHSQKRGRERRTRRERAAEQNAGRKKVPPTQVTEIQLHALERCATRDYKLSGPSVLRRRQVIDLPAMTALQVVDHRVIKRWCPVCQMWHVPKLDLSGDVMGQGRIGHGIASLVSWLRTTLRLPVKLSKSSEVLKGKPSARAACAPHDIAVNQGQHVSRRE